MSNKIRAMNFCLEFNEKTSEMKAKATVIFRDLPETQWGCNNTIATFDPSSVEHDHLITLMFESLLRTIQEGKSEYDKKLAEKDKNLPL